MQKDGSLGRAKGMCPECDPKMCCFVRRFSVRQVSRFHWDESRTAPSRHAPLACLVGPCQVDVV